MAIASVTESQAKRSMGRAGHLDVTLDYVRSVSGEKIRLRGIQNSKGGGHTAAVTGAIVATAVVFWPAAPLFLFVKGKDITIPKGHEVVVFVDGDQSLSGLTEQRSSGPKPSAVVESTVQGQSKDKPLTNEDVLTLKLAGFGDEFIVTKIKNSNAMFNVETVELVKLKLAGLSEAVIGAMVQANTQK